MEATQNSRFSDRLVGVWLAVAVSAVILTAVVVSIAARPAPVLVQRPEGVSAAARISFDAKVRTLAAAAAEVHTSGVARSIELSFTEDEVLSRAADNVSDDGNMEIHLLNNSIVAKFRRDEDGVTYTTSLLATPEIVGGQTRFVLTNYNQSAYRGTVHLGSTVAAPALIPTIAIPTDVLDRMRKTLDPAELGLTLDISSLRVIDSQLVVTGLVRP